jgi:hypothetical protein
MGRRPLGRRAMTNAERQRKFYAKQRRAKIWGANSERQTTNPAPQRSGLLADAAMLDRCSRRGRVAAAAAGADLGVCRR